MSEEGDRIMRFQRQFRKARKAMRAVPHLRHTKRRTTVMEETLAIRVAAERVRMSLT